MYEAVPAFNVHGEEQLILTTTLQLKPMDAAACKLEQATFQVQPTFLPYTNNLDRFSFPIFLLHRKNRSVVTRLESSGKDATSKKK